MMPQHKISSATMLTRKFFGAPIPLVCALLLTASQSLGQIRAGASYLKVLPDARSQGIAGSLTGAIDNMYAIYANPGATGLLREWQWSLSYTQWIPDIYNTSAFWGKRLRLPWSSHSRVVLGISYLGIKDFDSSKGRAPFASGGDLLVNASIGQPLGAITNGISLGGSVKYLRSRLDQFDANAFMFDLGLLYRTPQFRFLNTGLGIFDRGIFSAGLSMTHVGRALNFKGSDTPLPRTMRAGIALNMGSHDKLQVHLAADYRHIRDENGYFSFGTELSWAQLVTFRGGYSFEKENLLRHYAVGLSLGLDDVRTNINSIIPGRNNALQMDLARLQSNSWFDAPYRGSINHYPVVPESFEFMEPALGHTVTTNSVRLKWEASREPDLFDEVKYWLLIDKDRTRIEQALQSFNIRAREDFFGLLDETQFIVNDTLSQNSYLLQNLVSSLQNRSCVEDYFWTVVAFDKDRHYRLIQKSGQNIAHFRVALPDLQIEITDTHLEESVIESQERYQGVATFIVKNAGTGVARNFVVAVYDSISARLADRDPAIISNLMPLKLDPARILELPPGGVDSMTVEWQTPVPETHHIIAWVDQGDEIEECNENNNWSRKPVTAVPLLTMLPPPETPPSKLSYDLALTKQADRDTIVAGEQYNYVLTVTNRGPEVARDFTLLDALPKHVEPVQFSLRPDSILSTSITLKWIFESLAVDSSANISYAVQVDRSAAERGGPLHLEGVTFELDRAELTPAAKIALDKFAVLLAQKLQENPNDSLEIGGHTDSAGSDEYNLGLSQRRAESVKAYLISKDKIFERLIAKGYGERRPVVPNRAECREKNRRVEISIPRQAETIAPMLVNWSRVLTQNDPDSTNNTASDTVYVRSESLPSLVRHVNFNVDKWGLTPPAKETLDKDVVTLSRILQADSSIYIEIAGHTDSTASEAYNLALSRKRAQSVMEYFKTKCIWPDRMKAAGYGEQYPIADNGTPEGRAQNRRIEFHVKRRNTP
jgi:uncharacterized repeat protein (TIGR01451 family)